MGKTTCDDLVWRIVEKRIFFGLTFQQIADELMVPRAIVWDTCQRVEQRSSYETWQGLRLDGRFFVV